MSDEKYITMEEILSMIDEKYDYAIDDEVRVLLQKSTLAESYKHLLTNKNVLRYFEYYAKSQGFMDYEYDKCIDTIGGTKSKKYNIQDVEKVLNTEDAKNRIDKIAKTKTLQGINGLVPRPLFNEYVRKLNDDKTELELLTGYTEKQIQLFSVPDDILDEEMRNLKQKITELINELKDVEEELKARGLIE